MQMCSDHWAQLRAAIEARGLGHLVANSSEEAAERMREQLEAAQRGDDDVKHGFDPLINANWAISSNALSAGGFYLMGSKPDGGQFCPLCEARDHMVTDDEGRKADVVWITLAADEQLGRARDLRLVPAQQ